MSADEVRIGIVGVGGVGKLHANYLHNNEVPRARLTAVCDVSDELLTTVRETYGESVDYFKSLDELCGSGSIDAVLIATPHYFHPEQTRQAFAKGLHVLCEKPAGVYTKQVKEMNEAAAQSGKIFSLMYMMRTREVNQKLQSLVVSGELGKLQRCVWINTAWYRTEAYYASGGWRATWQGEGGGVLMNQAPHELDLWQWICGMPKRVRAFCHFGKWHEIEVEDDVTAYVEYENGATGVFITGTGDYPGTNRLEITGDRGRVVLEDEKITFSRSTASIRDFSRDTDEKFGNPDVWECHIPAARQGAAHAAITKNFVDAILDGADLIVPGEEGLNSLSIANAMVLSSWTDDWVDLPLDDEFYYEELQKRIAVAKK